MKCEEFSKACDGSCDMGAASGLILGRSVLLLVVIVDFLHLSVVEGKIDSYSDEGRSFFDWKVQYATVTRLCNCTKSIVTVNGEFPGPTIVVREGDNVVVKVTNLARENVTLHWHGVRQLFSAWWDGPAYITQCPIQPGGSFTYRFTVSGQRGTLFWHAHVGFLRATVYGAFIVLPKGHLQYLFSEPQEVVMLLGDWFNADVSELERSLISGSFGASPLPDALLINGQPGHLYDCSTNGVMQVVASSRKSYLLRIINACLNMQLVFRVTKHKLTVVEIDGASYTKPFNTSSIFLSPGQSINVLLHADQQPGKYIMMASPHSDGEHLQFDKPPATAFFCYEECADEAPMVTLPRMPPQSDLTEYLHFEHKLRSLNSQDSQVPLHIDRRLFFTVGYGLEPCADCRSFNGSRLVGSMNNVTFDLPRTALLQADYFNMEGIFTTDFPDTPASKFDYTQRPFLLNPVPEHGTKLCPLELGESVQILLQDTGILGFENHPFHLHGYSLFLVGQALGDFQPELEEGFNLDDPPMRNTVGVLPGGWAAVRFTADNPGVWLFHCHSEDHSTLGMQMAFLVGGNNFHSTLPPPPDDLPLC